MAAEFNKGSLTRLSHSGGQNYPVLPKSYTALAARFITTSYLVVMTKWSDPTSRRFGVSLS
jgi:hypothetical protein